jgi:hypothetical protein
MGRSKAYALSNIWNVKTGPLTGGDILAATFVLTLLLCAALMVPALGAGSVTGAVSYAHSVLGLGFAAAAGLSGRYPYSG